MTLSRTELFDRSTRDITKRRGKTYGAPNEDFRRVSLIKEAVADCPNNEIRHAMEMIGVKMARLVTTPDHIDTIVDIAGYARTMVMVLDAQNGKVPSKRRKKKARCQWGRSRGSPRKISVEQAEFIRSNFDGVSWTEAEKWGVTYDCSASTIMNVVHYKEFYAIDKPDTPAEPPSDE